MNDTAHLRTMTNRDGAAVLDTRRGTIFTLNATGAQILQACERGETVETIATNLAADTGEGFEALKSDVSCFIEELKQRDLLPR